MTDTSMPPKNESDNSGLTDEEILEIAKCHSVLYPLLGGILFKIVRACIARQKEKEITIW